MHHNIFPGFTLFELLVENRMGHLNIRVGVYPIPDLIEEVYEGIGFYGQRKMAGFNAMNGLYGKHLENALTCRYGAPFGLKGQFFARGKGKALVAAQGVFRKRENKGKHYYYNEWAAQEHSCLITCI